VGAARAAPLVFLDHFGGGRASVCALSGLEIGLLFHALISVIRGERDARGNSARNLAQQSSFRQCQSSNHKGHEGHEGWLRASSLRGGGGVGNNKFGK
jgi:hypothetical protein